MTRRRKLTEAEEEAVFAALEAEDYSTAEAILAAAGVETDSMEDMEGIPLRDWHDEYEKE